MFWCSKEHSHLGGSFEYPQHMFQLRNNCRNEFLITYSYYEASGQLE